MADLTKPIAAPDGPRQQEGACACGRPGTRTVYTFGSLRREFGADAPFRCPSCREQHEVDENERRMKEDREWCERKAQESYAAAVAASWLPRLLLGLDEPYGHPRALEDARRWATGNLPALLLVGPPGTGKSYLAAWAANERMRSMRAAFLARAEQARTTGELGRDTARYPREILRWISAPQLFNWLSRPFESDERERADRLLNGRGPLVLDDIDKARATEFGAEQVFLAIDNAVNNGRPLIVTSNRPVSELETRWPLNGGAIASRLAGYCQQHLLAGDDRRLQQRAA